MSKKRTSSESFSDRSHYRHHHHTSSRSGHDSPGTSNYKRRKTSDEESNKKYESEPQKHFSFEHFKYELNALFSRSSVIDDNEEFWKFVRRYDVVQKKAQNKSENSDFQKVHCVPIALNMDIKKLFSQLNVSSDFTFEKFNEFCDVICLYNDFKQKEKFKKLVKLRENQKSLPIFQQRDAIISAVEKNRVVIVAGDTGCGKSTQVPQYLVAAGYKSIACTQPRRIACISLSKRVSFEILDKYGHDVGYQIRFEKRRGQNTRILFITEGLLLRQISTDPLLSSYDVIVIDEAHERHLHGDFLLGVIKCMLYQRPNLKLVLMSATINIQLFQNFFTAENPVIIQVPGRLYPIKLHYRPVSKEDQPKGEKFSAAPYIRILQLIDEKYPKDERGDVLMFLSGMSEISTVVEAAKEYAMQVQNWIILPLHSALSLSDQDKVFDYPPEGIRKCVVATNIAETSITIDGIRFVVDSGKMKQMTHDTGCRMQRLKEFWVSKASAEQRKGRAGRTGPGVCYRLYSEEQYLKLEDYTEPEIHRVPLDSLILQMLAMGLPDARQFPFIEAPPSGAIEGALCSLQQQGALTDDEQLTSMGRLLSELPVDVALGKVLLMGSLFHHSGSALALAAALSVQNPFVSHSHRDLNLESSRKELESDHGDPITLLAALKQWLEIKESTSGKSGSSQSRLWCRRHGLEEQRFYEMVKLKHQFTELLQESGILYSQEVEEADSSAKRTLRHGELQMLRSLQRKHHTAEPRRRRRLRLNIWQLADEDEEQVNNEVDIQDVEFRLKNDSSQLKNLVLGATAHNHKDLTMLKVILVSGLYPQLAVADEFNSCKSVSELLFHTPKKPFVALHPTSYFACNSQIIQLNESDIENDYKHGNSKTPVSSQHQLLCYMSLLETTKPYLLNNLRMPAAQTLFLFSQHIDTNSNFSRVVFDEWLELNFPSPVAVGSLLVRVAHLRAKWSRLLTLKLQAMKRNSQTDDQDEVSQNTSKLRKETNKLSSELSEELPSFLHTQIIYSMKRLLAADQKIMYVGPGMNYKEVDPNPFIPRLSNVKEDSSDVFTPNPHLVKGGIRLTQFLTYDCLEEDDSDSDPFIEWKCPICELSCPLSIMEQLQHKIICKSPSELKQVEEEKVEEDEDNEFTSKPNVQAYICKICNKKIFGTSTDILRHRQQCKSLDSVTPETHSKS